MKSFSVVAAVASLTVFIVVFKMAGFLLPAVLMLILWLRVFGRESWRSTITLALAGPATLFVIFDQLLGLPFPNDLVLHALSLIGI